MSTMIRLIAVLGLLYHISLVAETATLNPPQVREAPIKLQDSLPSWNEGVVKDAILAFLKATTEVGGKDYVAPEDRIATFDQDGTLWVEQPQYTKVVFALETHSGKAENEKQILVEAMTNMTVSQFYANVAAWLKKSVHPRFKRPYTQLIYQPMLEVLRLFRQYGYRTYIVSGGGQEFIRVYAQDVYGIPPEQIVGTSGKLKYEWQGDHPVLMKLPEILFIDDKAGKPQDIQLMIGKIPVAAFGNSVGDREMLEWTQSRPGLSLMVLVHHDDAEREYAYGPESKIGTFSEALKTEAEKKGWHIISMKRDWREIFPPANQQPL